MYFSKLFFIFISTITLLSQAVFCNFSNPNIPSATGITNIPESTISSNPSILSEINEDFLLVQVQPNKFNIKDLNPIFLILGKKFKNFSLALSIDGIGNYIFNQFKTAVIFSTNITEDFKAGFTTEFSRLSIKDYNNYTNLKFNIGTILKITDNLIAGISFTNINRNYFDGTDKTANLSSLLGISYNTTENIAVELGTKIKIGGNSSIFANSCFHIFDFFTAKFAIQTNPQTIETGVSLPIYNYSHISFDLSYNNYLGFSPIISILFLF